MVKPAMAAAPDLRKSLLEMFDMPVWFLMFYLCGRLAPRSMVLRVEV